MPTIMLLVVATLSSFFANSKAELTLTGCDGGCASLQNMTIAMTCTGFEKHETVSLNVTGKQVLVFLGECDYNMSMLGACSPVGQYFNISLNQHGNVSEITIDPRNGTFYPVNCSSTKNATICLTQYSPCMTTFTTNHNQEILSTSPSSTTTATTSTTPTTPPTTPTTQPTTLTTITPTTPTLTNSTTLTTTPTSAAATTSTTTTATAPPTTSQTKGGENSTAETTRIITPTSATPDNSYTQETTLDRTSEKVTSTEGTRILSHAEVAGIAVGMTAFIALLLVLIVLVIVCKRKRKQKKYTATHRNRGTRASVARRTASDKRNIEHPHLRTDSKSPATTHTASHAADFHHGNVQGANPASDEYTYAIVEKGTTPKKTSTAARPAMTAAFDFGGSSDPDPDSLTMISQHLGNHARPLLLKQEWSPVIPNMKSSQESKKPPDQGHVYADIDIGNHSAELANERDGILEPETEQDREGMKNAAKLETAAAHSFPEPLTDHTTDSVSEVQYNTLSFTPRRPSVEAVEEDYSHVTSLVTDDLEYNTRRYVSFNNPSYENEENNNHIQLQTHTNYDY